MSSQPKVTPLSIEKDERLKRVRENLTALCTLIDSTYEIYEWMEAENGAEIAAEKTKVEESIRTNKIDSSSLLARMRAKDLTTCLSEEGKALKKKYLAFDKQARRWLAVYQAEYDRISCEFELGGEEGGGTGNYI